MHLGRKLKYQQVANQKHPLRIKILQFQNSIDLIYLSKYSYNFKQMIIVNNSQENI